MPPSNKGEEYDNTIRKSFRLKLSIKYGKKYGKKYKRTSTAKGAYR